MRIFLLVCCCFILGACASLETRLREERADRADIEEAFASPEPRIRLLAVESCVWSPAEDCDERLASLLYRDEAAEVREAAIATLARRCTAPARETLVRAAEVQAGIAWEALAEAARRCPTADLVFVLERGDHEASEAASLAEREVYLAWLTELLELHPPLERAAAMRRQVRRALERDYAEEARAVEVAALLREGWRALEAGDVEAAGERVAALSARGAPVGALFRGITTLHFETQRAAFDDAIRRGALDEAEEILEEAVNLRFEDPSRRARIEALRYQRLRPKAQEAERLAKAGKIDEARDTWRAIYRDGGSGLLADFARASHRRASALVERGRFDEAWRESWMLRAAEIQLSEEFTRHYARERWRREGFEMNPGQLRAFVEEMGELAPPGAHRRRFFFDQLDRARAGESQAARSAVGLLGEDLQSALRQCREGNQEFSALEMPDALEYVAQRVPTSRQRIELRKARDEGRAIARSFEASGEKLGAFFKLRDSCQGSISKLAYFEGAPPGSEAYERARGAAAEVGACLQALLRELRTFQRQGSRCEQFVREATQLIQRNLNE